VIQLRDDKTIASIYLPKRDLALIDMVAAKQGMKRNKFIVTAINEKVVGIIGEQKEVNQNEQQGDRTDNVQSSEDNQHQAGQE